MTQTTPSSPILRTFLLSLFFIPTLLLQAADRPNVLFIMSDDHAAHAIGAYGGRLAALDPTPTLDRLAEEGMLFENAFCTNSICTPSRACILTGQYPHTNGVFDLGGRIEPGK
ncbi:MAG: sulfatase-like hydrolase/transferase, partial [Verrucomicrobiota bacterium]